MGVRDVSSGDGGAGNRAGGVGNRPLRRVDVAYILIFDPAAQRILMVRNDHGSWTLPGGMREPGETLQETARREAREETGLEVRVGPVVHVAERIWHEHTLFVTFRADVVGGTLGAGLLGDVREVAWKGVEEAQELMPYYEDLQSLLTASAKYQCHRDT